MHVNSSMIRYMLGDNRQGQARDFLCLFVLLFLFVDPL